MKKFLFLCCLLQISISGLAHDFEVDGIYYNITSSEEATVAVTYEGSYISWSDEYTGDVVINDIVEFDGTTYSVTSIGDSAFSGCTGLTSVTIPESVASIGGWAFSGCSGLTSVTIPESLTSIGNCAFQGCTSLTSVTIPESLTSIGYSAFSGTAWYDNQPDGVVYAGKVAYTYKGTMGANTEMVLAEGTVVIAEYAFRFQTALKSVIIPNSVTSIGNSAFANCTNLTSVTIGNSVTKIGEGAFDNCSRLESIVVENGNPVYNSYNNCNAIIETSSNTLILGCKTTVIPNSVTSIGGSAFSGCTGLASVTIPNSVTSIGKYAFASCYALTSINIPNSVTSIGIWAFGECSGLTSIVVESGNVNFDSRDGCNAIIATSTNTLITGCKNTIIPNSVTAIGEGAFCGCSGLTSISIPSSVTSIGREAFEFCRSLTSITIPESVTSIGNHAFYDTSWYDNQPDGLVYAGKVAYKYKGTMPTNTSIVLENGTIGIAEFAFFGCEGLTSITIPNSVTCIEMYAFYNCI